MSTMMQETDKTPRPSFVGRLIGVSIDYLASMRLAVVLIVVLAGVLAWATVLEADQGREMAQWYVYTSSWFIGLLGLLGVNILAATMVRFPWRKTRRGFVTTHAGLLVLLFGAIQTFSGGVDGTLSVEEGETADALLLRGRSQFTTGWPNRKDDRPNEFIFRPGPVDWPEGKTFDFGEFGGVHLKVKRFLRHARVEEQWVKDPTGEGRPAVHFAVVDTKGNVAQDSWLATEMFGAEAQIGPAKCTLDRASTESILEDFKSPPELEGMDPSGVLSVHYDGNVQRIAVGENLGKKVPLGSSGIEVEVLSYLPNAHPEAGGGFKSVDDNPENPVVELAVHLPDREEPARQVAFAMHPLLSLDGIHGRSSPVKFWYHHPAVTPQPGVQFLQTPDGKLYARACLSGAYHFQGEVEPGRKLPMAAMFKISVLEYFKSARKETLFRSLDLAKGETSGPEAAALVEVTAGGTTEEFWLKRADLTHGFRRVATEKGPLAIGFGYERLPLGFKLKLVEFERKTNPGRRGDASFASQVRLVDERAGIRQDHRISMNEPLMYGGYTFYQSGFNELPDGRKATVLTVASDPGRALKYLGSLMISLGVLMMFYARSLLGKLPLVGRLVRKKKTPAAGAKDASRAAATPNQRKRRRPAAQSAKVA